MLRSAWGTFKTNWKVLVPIAIVPTVLFILGQIFGYLKNPVAGLLAGIFAIAGFIFSIAMQGALLTAIRRVESEPGFRPVLKEQYRIGFSYFWSMLLIMIISIVCFIGSFSLLIIPGIIFMVFASFAVYTRVFDDKRGFEAFVESYKIVRGRWWAVFGRALFLILVYIIVAIIVGLILGLLQMILGIDSQSVGAGIVGIIINLVLAAIFGVLAPIYLLRLFDSLKRTRLPDAEGKTFKGWMIAFLIIGIIAIIIIPIVAAFIIGQLIQSSLQNFQNLNVNGIPLDQLDFESLSPSTLSTSSSNVPAR